jgi:hypothetical protein
MIRVVNLFTASPEERARAIYIGRYSRDYCQPQSPLGNPYKVTTGQEPEQAVALYRIWLWQRIQEQGKVYRELERIAQLAKQGEEVLLMCYCAPRICHGDVVKKAIEWMLKEGKV